MHELGERDYILFMDTEGSDLMKPDLPLTHEAQPWPVRVSCKLVGYDRKPRSFVDLRIRATEEMTISPGAEAVHGISTIAARKFGVEERMALWAVSSLIAQASLIVGFGVKYDVDLLLSRVEKNGWTKTHILRAGTKIIDVMAPGAQQICKLLPAYEREDQQFKWPNLEEAVLGVLGVNLKRDKHDSWEDLEWAERLFWKQFDDRVMSEPLIDPFGRRHAS